MVQSADPVEQCEDDPIEGELQVLKNPALTAAMDGLYMCNVCGNNFGNAGELNVHISTHMSDKLRTCSDCSKRCETYRSEFLQVHQS